jgi:hypothetical protein
MAKPYLDADGNFSMPLLVADLNDVPKGFREGYQLVESGRATGKYMLTREARQLKDEYYADVKRVHEEGKAGVAAKNAEVEKFLKDGEDEIVTAALTTELTAQGATPGLVKGAVALLKERYAFDIEGSDFGDGKVVLARNDFGLSSVEGVVKGLLESDEGTAFRSRSAAPSVSYFTQMLSGLRARR